MPRPDIIRTTQNVIQTDSPRVRDNAGNDAVNLFLIEPPVIYRAIVACKCQPIGTADDTSRRRLSHTDDRPLFAVAVHTDRSRIPCQTQATRYCFCLTATGSFDIVCVDCAIKVVGYGNTRNTFRRKRQNALCVYL